MHETDRRRLLTELWCNTRAILCKKLWNMQYLWQCSILFRSGSPRVLPTPSHSLYEACTQELLSDSLVSRCEGLGEAKTGSTWLKEYGSLGNVGSHLLRTEFYETGNTKETFTIKRPLSEGVSSLASMRRKKDPKKNISVCNNVVKLLASGLCHGCQTTFPITLFSHNLSCMSVPVGCTVLSGKKLLCMHMFPRGKLHV